MSTLHPPITDDRWPNPELTGLGSPNKVHPRVGMLVVGAEVAVANVGNDVAVTLEGLFHPERPAVYGLGQLAGQSALEPAEELPEAETFFAPMLTPQLRTSTVDVRVLQRAAVLAVGR